MKEVIGRHGGIPVIIQGMRAHSMSADLLKSSCGALSNICQNRHNQTLIAAHGGTACILRALEDHHDQPSLLPFVFDALASLIVGNGANGREASDAGAIAALLKAMRAHMDCGELVKSACHALAVLSDMQGQGSRIADSGGAPVVLEALRANPSRGDLHRVAAVVLLRMLQEAPVAPDIARRGGVALMLAVMREQLCEAETVAACSHILFCITRRSVLQGAQPVDIEDQLAAWPEPAEARLHGRPRASRPGGRARGGNGKQRWGQVASPAVLVPVLSRYHGRKDVSRTAVRALRELCRHRRTCQGLLAAKVLPPLLRVLVLYPQARDIVDGTAALVKALAAHQADSGHDLTQLDRRPLAAELPAPPPPPAPSSPQPQHAQHQRRAEEQGSPSPPHGHEGRHACPCALRAAPCYTCEGGAVGVLPASRGQARGFLACLKARPYDAALCAAVFAALAILLPATPVNGSEHGPSPASFAAADTASARPRTRHEWEKAAAKAAVDWCKLVCDGWCPALGRSGREEEPPAERGGSAADTEAETLRWIKAIEACCCLMERALLTQSPRAVDVLRDGEALLCVTRLASCLDATARVERGAADAADAAEDAVASSSRASAAEPIDTSTPLVALSARLTRFVEVASQSAEEPRKADDASVLHDDTAAEASLVRRALQMAGSGALGISGTAVSCRDGQRGAAPSEEAPSPKSDEHASPASSRDGAHNGRDGDGECNDGGNECGSECGSECGGECGSECESEGESECGKDGSGGSGGSGGGGSPAKSPRLPFMKSERKRATETKGTSGRLSTRRHGGSSGALAGDRSCGASAVELAKLLRFPLCPRQCACAPPPHGPAPRNPAMHALPAAVASEAAQAASTAAAEMERASEAGVVARRRRHKEPEVLAGAARAAEEAARALGASPAVQRAVGALAAGATRPACGLLLGAPRYLEPLVRCAPRVAERIVREEAAREAATLGAGGPLGEMDLVYCSCSAAGRSVHSRLPVPTPYTVPRRSAAAATVERTFRHSLTFDSCFESGNLLSAVQRSEDSYDLFLRADLHTGGFTQWFYFAVSNTHAPGQPRGTPARVTFRICNLTKPDSLFNQGMRPVKYSMRDAEERGVGWVRTGRDILYRQNLYRREPGAGSAGGGGSVAAAGPTGDEGEKPRRGKAQGQGGGYYFTLTFTVDFEHVGDTVLLAHSYPYTYSDHQRHLADILSSPQKRKFVRRSQLTATLGGHAVDLLTITDFSKAPGGSAYAYPSPGELGSGEDGDASPPPQHAGGTEPRKRTIVFSGRVHPGETPASWMMRGLLDLLVGGSETARRLRSMFVFKIIPMLNPDGVVFGNNRCSLSATDLNRAWKKPSRALHPPVYYAKTMIRHEHTVREVAAFVDLHGHSRKFNIFMYGCDDRRKPRPTVRVFPKLLSWNRLGGRYVSFDDCSFSVRKGREGTGRVVVAREINIKNSYTLEATFCGADFGPLAGCHFNTEHFMEVGRGLADALLDYYLPNHASPSPQPLVSLPHCDAAPLASPEGAPAPTGAGAPAEAPSLAAAVARGSGRSAVAAAAEVSAAASSGEEDLGSESDSDEKDAYEGGEAQRKSRDGAGVLPVRGDRPGMSAAESPPRAAQRPKAAGTVPLRPKVIALASPGGCTATGRGSDDGAAQAKRRVPLLVCSDACSSRRTRVRQRRLKTSRIRRGASAASGGAPDEGRQGMRHGGTKSGGGGGRGRSVGGGIHSGNSGSSLGTPIGLRIDRGGAEGAAAVSAGEPGPRPVRRMVAPHRPAGTRTGAADSLQVDAAVSAAKALGAYELRATQAHGGGACLALGGGEWAAASGRVPQDAIGGLHWGVSQRERTQSAQDAWMQGARAATANGHRRGASAATRDGTAVSGGSISPLQTPAGSRALPRLGFGAGVGAAAPMSTLARSGEAQFKTGGQLGPRMAA